MESLAASSTSGQSCYGLAKSADYRPVAVCGVNFGYTKLLFTPFRNYTVVNPEKGVIEVERMSCPGMKLCCQLKFQNALWAATEVSVAGASVPCSRGASLEETQIKERELIKLVKRRVFETMGISDEQRDFASAVAGCIVSACYFAGT